MTALSSPAAPALATSAPRAAGPGDIAIEAAGVRKRYGSREVLVDVSFSVARGELLALLGPNGAGKTTTVEILEGYRRADAGRVRVLGLDPVSAGARLRPRIGLMLQEGGIDPRTTPREALRLYARFYADPEDPEALLDLVDLRAAAGTRYRRLSGGERQRLGLALALIGRPELLVLDEPTAGMDPAAKQATRERIASLRAGGTTILLTTHELADVARMADRVAILDRGRLVALGTPDELTGSGERRVRFRLARPLTADDARALGGALAGRSGDTRLDIVADGRVPGAYEIRGLSAAPDPSLVATLAEWCAGRRLLLAELRVGSASLEERYLELVGRDVAAEGETDESPPEDAAGRVDGRLAAPAA